MSCEYCVYRNSWDCGDGWNRRRNCDSFKLNWDLLSEKEKKTIDPIKLITCKEGIYNIYYNF